MQAFTRVNGIVAPLDRPNVDTDAIIPKQFLKSIKRSGFGPNLFDEWRYQDQGEPGQDCSGRPLKKDFVLNLPRYKDTRVLLARDNFGCGSSREHAVWAMEDFGIQCVIAPSFADIFYSNCGKNGILAIRLTAEKVDQLFKEVDAEPGYALDVDLVSQRITTPSGESISFDIDPSLKERLLEGLDDIAITLLNADDIKAYEARRKPEAPWMF